MSMELIATLRERGVDVWTDGGEVRYRAPAGVMTYELRDRLRQHKEVLLRMLMLDEAVEGLGITAEQYRAWLDADDIADIAAGRIPVKTLRAYAEIAAKCARS